MPPRLSLPWSTLRPARRKLLNSYICPTCTFRNLTSSQRPIVRTNAKSRFDIARARRHVATISPATSINAQIEVIPENRELYLALDALRQHAANYVNLSRLQLALRGIQTSDAVIRVAILGIEQRTIAQDLVRVILADVLGDEATWEKSLRLDQSDERAVLLRYGEDGEMPSPNPLLRTILVPSPMLRDYNLEILISSLNFSLPGLARLGVDKPEDAILVPTLQTQTSSSGRSTPVTYPVHKSLIIGEGLDKAIAFGQFISPWLEKSRKNAPIRLAIGVPGAVGVSHQQTESRSQIVDVQLASTAIARFRESVSNSLAYEQGWFRSGVAPLQKWLTENSDHSAEGVKVPVQELIASVLEDTNQAIALEENERLSTLVNTSISQSSKVSVLSSLSEWAEHSHRELRDQLDAAFAGRHWRKIAWWKLFWRVDDVTMITSEILERRWLLDAEKGVIFVAGRIVEAGLVKSPEGAAKDTVITAFGNALTRTPKSSSRTPKHIDEGLATPVPLAMPWPAQISTARAQLLTESVAPLQALAQDLVVQTLSTTGLSAALSGLIYLSSSYWLIEAGAVAAFGLVFSLRRMQRRWEAARNSWEAEVREQGRRTLKETEEKVRLAVEVGSKPQQDVEGVKERRLARETVEKASRLFESRMGSSR